MPNPIKWTEEKINLLRQLYPSNLTKDIAHIFGITPKALSQVALKHGIRKNPEIRARNGESGQFKKGLVPFNKGKKWDDYMSEEGRRNSSRTQFRRGQLPHNIRPMYSERINDLGYVEIKVPGHRKFVMKHRWIWEAHHGPIPKDHIIYFLDGDKSNCEISNLGIMTRAENRRRNGLWSRYPKEIAELHQLKGALTRQINKHRKSNQ